MNVYDFDGTIFKRDTTVMFYLWCLKRHPRIARRWPGVLFALIGWKAGRRTKTEFKQTFLGFLRDVPDVSAQLEAFWDRNLKNIQPWYFKAHRPDDIVVTASPQGFVEPACRRLGIVRVIGSPVDLATGAYDGVNCDGEAKVAAFQSLDLPDRPDRFYSDSLNDAPMARLAREAYLVRRGVIAPWPEKFL